jgi:hypothetical protein
LRRRAAAADSSVGLIRHLRVTTIGSRFWRDSSLILCGSALCVWMLAGCGGAAVSASRVSAVHPVRDSAPRLRPSVQERCAAPARIQRKRRIGGKALVGAESNGTCRRVVRSLTTVKQTGPAAGASSTDRVARRTITVIRGRHVKQEHPTIHVRSPVIVQKHPTELVVRTPTTIQIHPVSASAHSK